MRKISLDVNALRVESFETVDDKAKARGTVHGYYTQFTCPRTQCGEECLSGPYPCHDTMAWTNGQAACYCNNSLNCID
ncbi:MAG TPA: hypothetical protein VFS20_18745 [Longimicrobium sp.]|nr:hypothetical protein [Longimicrobium sp.]